MKHVEVAEFQVRQGEMQAFTSAMQTWERLALHDPDGPLHHSVLVGEEDACKVIAVTEFADETTAKTFHEKGLGQELLHQVAEHCDMKPTVRSYTLYYAAGPEGPDTVFGEPAH
jgi:hypothetical protein